MPRMPAAMEEQFADAMEAALAREHPALPILGEVDDETASRPGGIVAGIFRGRNGGGRCDRYVCARLGDGTWLSAVCDPARAGNAGFDPSSTWNATVAAGWTVAEDAESDGEGFAEEVLLGYADLGRLLGDALEALAELTPAAGSAPRP